MRQQGIPPDLSSSEKQRQTELFDLVVPFVRRILAETFSDEKGKAR